MTQLSRAVIEPSPGKSGEPLGRESLVLMVNGWTFLAVLPDMVSSALQGPQETLGVPITQKWDPRKRSSKVGSKKWDQCKVR